MGDTSGIATCGSRVFSLEKYNSTTPSVRQLGISIISNKNGTNSLVLNPKKDQYIGNHTVNMTVKLGDYWLDGPEMLLYVAVVIQECKVG